eukprot:TRINITY_DN2560_c0_g1_i1.p2 TRINITY_DN2560_c0_g1~~TRINITY_DN2560_c0_g1_i1.p2  ORF type:complete len:384 (+),score=120.84 TRINITY_DN2560_c0_g1_i1:1540-2691(+)
MLQSITNFVQTTVLRRSDAQILALQLTNSTDETPKNQDLQALCELSRNYEGYTDIFEVFYQRLKQSYHEYISISKTLHAIQYLIIHGSDSLLDLISTKFHRLIRTLENFEFFDSENQDKGRVVRNNAKRIMLLVTDPSVLADERAKVKDVKKRLTGITGNDRFRGLTNDAKIVSANFRSTAIDQEVLKPGQYVLTSVGSEDLSKSQNNSHMMKPKEDQKKEATEAFDFFQETPVQPADTVQSNFIQQQMAVKKKEEETDFFQVENNNSFQSDFFSETATDNISSVKTKEINGLDSLFDDIDTSNFKLETNQKEENSFLDFENSKKNNDSFDILDIFDSVKPSNNQQINQTKNTHHHHQVNSNIQRSNITVSHNTDDLFDELFA